MKDLKSTPKKGVKSNGCCVELLDVKKEGVIVKTPKGKTIKVNNIVLSAGTTINTGEFNNIKLSAMITLTALDDDITLSELSAFGWGYVEGELGVKVHAVRQKYNL